MIYLRLKLQLQNKGNDKKICDIQGDPEKMQHLRSLISKKSGTKSSLIVSALVRRKLLFFSAELGQDQ